MKKTSLLITILTLILFSSSLVYGEESTSVGFQASGLEVDAEGDSFEVEIVLSSPQAFSAAEFALVLDGVEPFDMDDMSFVNLTVDNLQFTIKDNVYHFGFYDMDNVFEAHGVICRISMKKAGSDDGSVRLIETKIGRFADDETSSVEILDPVEMTVTLADAGNEPGGDTGSNPGGDTGSGNPGGDTGSGDDGGQTGDSQEETIGGDEGIPEGLLEVNFLDLHKAPWASAYIIFLAERGIVNGTSPSTFDPDGMLTREAFIKMLVGSLGLLDQEAVASFTDLESGKWYNVYIASAEKYGITQGIGGGKFGIGQKITREQMAAMAYRAIKAVGKDLAVQTEEMVFSDFDLIASYAIEPVQVMQKAGIFSGKGNNRFAPKDLATRAEAAKIVYMLMQD